MSTYRTIATYYTVHEAHLSRMLLETAGIRPTLFDDNLISIHPLYSIALGGVKLAVRDYEAVEAKVVLSEHEKVQRKPDEQNEHSCPRCSSLNIRKTFRFNLLLIPLILISLTLLGMITIGLACWISLHGKYKCTECDHDW